MGCCLLLCLLLPLLCQMLLLLLMVVLQMLLLSSRHVMHVVRLAPARRNKTGVAVQLPAAPLKRPHHTGHDLRKEQLRDISIQWVHKRKIH